MKARRRRYSYGVPLALASVTVMVVAGVVMIRGMVARVVTMLDDSVVAMIPITASM